MALDLVALEAPLEPVRFPNGREFAVREFGPAEWELWQRIQAGETEHTATLIRRCVPDATDADLDTLSPRMAAAIVGHAQHKLEVVLAALGNAGGAETARNTPPSAPSRTPSTPSPASPARSAPGSTRSGTSRSGAPSGRSTHSRTSSGSTT
jgi:hypothetical protein